MRRGSATDAHRPTHLHQKTITLEDLPSMLTSDTAFLFPELGQAEIDDLLYTVSGISVSDIAPVTDNTQGLAELAGRRQ